MVNLIEKFIEDAGIIDVALADSEEKTSQEVYFFMGKNSVLCISKRENRVLYNIEYNKLQITLLGPDRFSFNVNGQSLFFYQV